MTIIAFSEGTHGAKGRPLEFRINTHLATGKNISVANEPAPQYNNGGIDNLLNGINGSNVRYGDNEWRGFSGVDFDATIDLGNRHQVSYIETRCFQGHGQGIHLPDYIHVLLSTDGTVYSKPFPMQRHSGTGKVFGYRLSIPTTDAQFIKIVAKNMGTIPEGMELAGSSAWVFVDEIIVR
jgi:hexosaminidase